MICTTSHFEFIQEIISLGELANCGKRKKNEKTGCGDNYGRNMKTLGEFIVYLMQNVAVLVGSVILFCEMRSGNSEGNMEDHHHQ